MSDKTTFIQNSPVSLDAGYGTGFADAIQLRIPAQTWMHTSDSQQTNNLLIFSMFPDIFVNSQHIFDLQHYHTIIFCLFLYSLIQRIDIYLCIVNTSHSSLGIYFFLLFMYHQHIETSCFFLDLSTHLPLK